MAAFNLQFLSREQLREASQDASRKLSFVRDTVKNIPEQHIPFNRLQEITFLEERVQEYKKELAKRLSQNIPIRIFYSYSQIDQPLMMELDEKLSDLRGAGAIETFWDQQINVGSEWHSEIVGKLNSADIILLMISADFLKSDYCQQVEMPAALEMHSYGLNFIIPVILRKCEWQKTIFGTLQAIPRNCKPVADWNERDEAWKDIIQNINEKIEKIRRSGFL